MFFYWLSSLYNAGNGCQEVKFSGKIPEKSVCSSGIGVDYALTAPEVMPSMYSRELNMNMSSSGIVAMTKPAIIAP